MINLITSKELLYEEMFDELRKTGLPNVFYGTSDAAKEFYERFNQSKLNIDTVMVSPEYYRENTYFFDHKILNKESFLKEIKKYPEEKKINVIVYFGINDELLDQLNNIEAINKVYLIDGGVCFLTNFTYEYIEKRDEEYTETFNLLEDELSKNIMIGFINTRISGYADDIRKYSTLESYFPKDVVTLDDDEVFLDCGAFDGDTIKIFKEQMKLSGKSYKKIYGFEPDKENFKKLQMNCANDDKIILVNTGVFNKCDILSFSGGKGGGSRVNQIGNSSIEVDMIDNLIEKDIMVTFVKMDLEGVELEALNGAKDTISRDKPTLAIAVYHKIDDLIEIPKYLKSIVPEYKFYLRAQCYDSVDMTLFAVIK